MRARALTVCFSLLIVLSNKLFTAEQATDHYTSVVQELRVKEQQALDLLATSKSDMALTMEVKYAIRYLKNIRSQAAQPALIDWLGAKHFSLATSAQTPFPTPYHYWYPALDALLAIGGTNKQVEQMIAKLLQSESEHLHRCAAVLMDNRFGKAMRDAWMEAHLETIGLVGDRRLRAAFLFLDKKNNVSHKDLTIDTYGN